MKFIDEASISVYAGKGGAGCRSFRREKFVPLGGPDGGDGGRGGSIILVADANVHTLLDFRFQPKWEAENGRPGQGSGRSGKSGQDLIIKVPIGTQVFDSEDGELTCDLFEANQQFVLAEGGRGGKGNSFFKTATNQAPEHAQPGEEGEHGVYNLSLKLVADVGLIGLPNAGKSTLISRISAAKPKIADYPFTTLVPNLGVVQPRSGRTFVVADIPGLIPGASKGKGLGIKFLKHVERTKVLAHLIDASQTDGEGNPLDPCAAFDEINFELKEFSEDLAARPQIVVLTKEDVINEEGFLDKVKKQFADRGVPCVSLSSATGKGLNEFLELLAERVFRAA